MRTRRAVIKRRIAYVNRVLYAKQMGYDGFGNIMTGLTEAEFDHVYSMMSTLVPEHLGTGYFY